jgi:hypothetical protein
MVILRPSHQAVAADFEAQTGKPEATDFEANLEETKPVILMSNH